MDAVEILRSRRRRQDRQMPLRSAARLAVALAALLGILAGTSGAILGWIYEDVRRGLPDVSEIEALLGSGEGPVFHPTRLLDRSGTQLVHELMSPVAAGRRWLSLAGEDADGPSAYIVLATVAALDEHFWTGPGFTWRPLLQMVISGGAPPLETTIPERLAEVTLLPPTDRSNPEWLPALRRTFLAAELTRRYSRVQILEWYLNVAPYGHGSFGVDAAALVYFGKHASELNLGEAAMLAALPDHSEKSPFDDPSGAEGLKSIVLDAMVHQGMIEEVVARSARAKTVRPRADGPLSEPLSGFERYALRELEELFGSSFLSRGGMIITTSLDADLQLQAECVLASHRERLNGMGPAWVEPAADGSACAAAALLPPLRPGDIGVDHNVDEARLVVIDPESGEVLSLIGDADLLRPSFPAIEPFVYLTAFSRGYGPGSMVLDVPIDELTAGDQAAPLPYAATYQGPVRMRTAMVGNLQAAWRQVVKLVGSENVASVLARMGLAPPEEVRVSTAQAIERGQAEAALIDLAFAYGTLANRGRMVGRGLDGQDRNEIRPLSILKVEDRSGQVLYEASPLDRPVLSAQLAFLMADVMRDESARWPSLGEGNPLEIGHPVGALASVSQDGRDATTIGFSPSRVTGVWLGNSTGEGMHGVTKLNGATAIWHAIMRYATRGLPSQGWEKPLGVVEVDVCDPSGLLPTRYCPRVVREYFVEGTEPTSFDTLYQPVLVNKETGKLATLFTPIDLAEERVYLVVPPEALQWARQAGIERPPTEYDAVIDVAGTDSHVAITLPEMFAVVRGSITIRGRVMPPDLQYYRLQYGQGLNPVSWIQIGADLREPVEGGVLGIWPTPELNGLYTLQLVAVHEEGRVTTASVAVTLDNQPPGVRLVAPFDGDVYRWPEQTEVIIQADVTDNSRIDGVEFYVDDERVTTLLAGPYSFRWKPGPGGEHEIYARAHDAAGNVGQSEKATITVVR